MRVDAGRAEDDCCRAARVLRARHRRDARDLAVGIDDEHRQARRIDEQRRVADVGESSPPARVPYEFALPLVESASDDRVGERRIEHRELSVRRCR